MFNFKSFKHRNMEILHYGTNAEEAGPETREGQTLNDWDRLAKSGQACTYYINGRKLSDLAPDGFASEKELKDFLIEHLFREAENPNLLAEAAIKHCHQAGLPHATNYSVTQQNQTQHQPRDPITRISFSWNNSNSNQGLQITEENTYKEWIHTGTGAKHRCTDAEPYYAETKTTYLLTPDAKIKLVDLQIDCPSQNLAEVFDKREASEQPLRGSLKNAVKVFMDMMHIKQEVMDTRAPEPRTIYEENGPKQQ